MPILDKVFQKTEEERTFCNSTCKVGITLILKPDKEIRRKISFIKMAANTLEKILTNEIHQYIKEIIHHDQMNLTPGIQDWYNI